MNPTPVGTEEYVQKTWKVTCALARLASWVKIANVSKMQNICTVPLVIVSDSFSFFKARPEGFHY